MTRDVYAGDEDLPAAAQSEFIAVLRIEADLDPSALGRVAAAISQRNAVPLDFRCVVESDACRIEARVKLCSSEDAGFLRRRVAQLTTVREVTLSSAPE
ncbi:MAG: hypothetical protein O9284_15085 [Steroidobacteraceae bacterium]|nr:hypothetical protein [Steroidobacteraceae bacterium]